MTMQAATKSNFIFLFQKLTLLKVGHILDEIYINDTINRSKIKIPLFDTWKQIRDNERDVIFFLNSQFEFKNQGWTSGFFKIQEKDWAVSETAEYKYPILGDGSYFSKRKLIFCISYIKSYHRL